MMKEETITLRYGKKKQVSLYYFLRSKLCRCARDRETEIQTDTDWQRTAILTHIFLAALCYIQGITSFLAGSTQPGTACESLSWPPDCPTVYTKLRLGLTLTVSVDGNCLYDFTTPLRFQFVLLAVSPRICFRLFTQVHPAQEISDWRPC